MIFNDPSVFPLVAMPDAEVLDATDQVSNLNNVLLMTHDGAMLFVWQEAGIYEARIGFLDKVTQPNAVRVCVNACEYMFLNTDAMQLLFMVPEINSRLEQLCAELGASFEFYRENLWPSKDGLHNVNFWALRFDDWLRKSFRLIDRGRSFAEHLAAERARLGDEQMQQSYETCLMRGFGMLAGMIENGQSEKGIILFNRFARLAGFPPIGLIARNPVMLDFGDMLVQFKGGIFKAILVRHGILA